MQYAATAVFYTDNGIDYSLQTVYQIGYTATTSYTPDSIPADGQHHMANDVFLPSASRTDWAPTDLGVIPKKFSLGPPTGRTFSLRLNLFLDFSSVSSFFYGSSVRFDTSLHVTTSPDTIDTNKGVSYTVQLGTFINRAVPVDIPFNSSSAYARVVYKVFRGVLAYIIEDLVPWDVEIEFDFNRFAGDSTFSFVVEARLSLIDVDVSSSSYSDRVAYIPVRVVSGELVQGARSSVSLQPSTVLESGSLTGSISSCDSTWENC